MPAAQPLSRTSKAAFVAVLVLPLAAVLTWATAASRTVTVDADLRVLRDGRTVQSVFTTNTCEEPLRLHITESAREVRTATPAALRRHEARSGHCRATSPAVRQVEVCAASCSCS